MILTNNIKKKKSQYNLINPQDHSLLVLQRMGFEHFRSKILYYLQIHIKLHNPLPFCATDLETDYNSSPFLLFLHFSPSYIYFTCKIIYIKSHTSTLRSVISHSLKISRPFQLLFFSRM